MQRRRECELDGGITSTSIRRTDHHSKRKADERGQGVLDFLIQSGGIQIGGLRCLAGCGISFGDVGGNGIGERERGEFGIGLLR